MKVEPKLSEIAGIAESCEATKFEGSDRSHAK
jgi:hypothetical protein